MDPLREQICSIDRAKIEQARRMTFEERFLAGAQLFEMACNVSRAGIRAQYPEADDDEVEQRLRDRI